MDLYSSKRLTRTSEMIVLEVANYGFTKMRTRLHPGHQIAKENTNAVRKGKTARRGVRENRTAGVDRNHRFGVMKSWMTYLLAGLVRRRTSDISLRGSIPVGWPS